MTLAACRSCAPRAFDASAALAWALAALLICSIAVEICDDDVFTSSALVDSSSAVAASSSADFCAFVEVFRDSAISARERAASFISAYALDCSCTDFWASWQAEVASSAAAAISSAPFRNFLAPASDSCAFFRISAQPAWIAFEIGRDLYQIVGDHLGLFDLLPALLAGRFGVRGDHLDLVLDLVDHFLNAARALLAHLRQIADFVGDYREAFAVLSGPCGFDRRVQSQQVGLVGDSRHGMNDLADLFRLPLQFRHHLGGLDVGLRRIVHALDQFLDIGLSRLGKRLQFVDLLSGKLPPGRWPCRKLSRSD